MNIELVRVPEKCQRAVRMSNPGAYRVLGGGDAFAALKVMGDYLVMRYVEWAKVLQAAEECGWTPQLIPFGYFATDGATVSDLDVAQLAKTLKRLMKSPLLAPAIAECRELDICGRHSG